MSNEKSHSASRCLFRLELSGGFLLLVSLTGFLCGGEALAAAFLAASFHELGHLIMILRQGSLPRRLILDISGACLDCCGPEISPRQELLRALAGPGLGLLFWWSLRGSSSGCLQMSSEMSLMLSLVNLMPAPGLDGYRILNCLLAGIAVPYRWERISRWLGFPTAVITVVLGIIHSPQLFIYGLWLFLRQVRSRLQD